MNKLRRRLVDYIIRLNEKYIFNRRLERYLIREKSLTFNNVIDVGSNTGQTIDFFLKINRNCNIYGFEPDKLLYAELSEKYTNRGNIHLVNMGISDVDGTKMFYRNILGSSSSLEPVNLASEYLKIKSRILGVKPEEIIIQQYPVEVCQLHTFLGKIEVTHFDLLKIDTEGHELACLIGLFSGEKRVTIDRIQIENHNDDMYRNTSTEIHDLLTTEGYRLETKLKHGFGGLEELIYAKIYV
ncbi:MAG: FkbM family methyltransferase [Saprospiraceae bacterium]|nr:FkbM family methyltransferase [Saprospiraceae bacterium]